MTMEPAPIGEPTTVAAAIEANINAYLLSFAAVPGAVLHDAPDCVWVDSGHEWSVFNSVVASRFAPDAVDAGIESVVAHFRRTSRAFTWHVGPSTVPADLGDRLVAHGLSLSEDEPGMAVDLHRIRADTPVLPGLTIQPVRDERELGEWVSVWLFPVPVTERQPGFDVLLKRGIGDEHPWRLYLGRMEGIPVATAELFVAGRSVSVQYVVTLPEFRRRGIGATMTRRLLQDARVLGLDLAVLTASPDGVGIYRRIGFREYCRFRRYEWEPNRPEPVNRSGYDAVSIDGCPGPRLVGASARDRANRFSRCRRRTRPLSCRAPLTRFGRG